MDLGLAAGGLFVGFLIGLTGMGGGSLMTPFLILVAGVRPVIAVGTDLAYGAITKWFGAAAHIRQRTVDFRMVFHLGLGSVPGSLAGVWVIHSMGGAPEADQLVKRLLGATLVLVAASLLFGRSIIHRRPRSALVEQYKTWLIILMGLAVGFLLGITSVGSGTLIMAALLIATRKRPAAQLVGIDIVHGGLLVTVAAAAHWSIGTVDWLVAANLLAGSIPGVLIGSRLSPKVPERFLRPALATVLLAVGTRLI